MVDWQTVMPQSRVTGDTTPIAPEWNKHIAATGELRGALKQIAITGNASDLSGQVVGLPLVPATGTTASAYTISPADVGRALEINSTSSVTVTIPTDASATIAVGSVIELVRMNTGAVTVTAANGVTLMSPVVSQTIRAQYSTIRLRKRGTNVWIVAGDLTPDTTSNTGGSGTTITPLLSDSFTTSSWDTTKWTTGGNFTFSVVSGAGRMTSVNSTGWHGRATAKIANTANVGVLLRYRFDAHNHVTRIFIRATGSLTNYAAGGSDFNGISLNYDHGNKTYLLQQWANGAGSSPSGANTVTRTLNPNSWYWSRIEAVGTSVRARTWVDGSSEPTTWDVSGLTSITQAGTVILTDAMYDTDSGWVIDWDDVTVYSVA